MQELREKLSRYEAKGGLDPVLTKFLGDKFGFNYAEAAKALSDDKVKANQELASLSARAQRLNGEIERENLQRRIEEAHITFRGGNLVKSEGSVVTCKCRCGTEFSWDISGTLGFQQLLNADTPGKMRFIVASGANQFEGMCPNPKCHQSSRVTADRHVCHEDPHPGDL